MRTKRSQRNALMLVAILVAITAVPAAATGGYNQRVQTTGWFGGISQWVEQLYANFTGFGAQFTIGVETSAATGESGSNVAGESGSNVAGESGSNVAGESGSNVAGESGSNVAGESGSNVAGESGSNLSMGSK